MSELNVSKNTTTVEMSCWFSFFAEFEFNMLHIDKVFRKVFFMWIIVIFLFKSFKAAVIVSFSIQTIILHGLIKKKKLCGAEKTVTPYDIFHVTLCHLITKTLISAALKVCFLHKQVPEDWPEFSFLFLYNIWPTTVVKSGLGINAKQAAQSLRAQKYQIQTGVPAEWNQMMWEARELAQ